MKKIYCKKCGSELDNNKKCTGCGKKYFKFNLRVFLLALFILLLISIISFEAYYIYVHKQDLTIQENNFATQKENLEKENDEMLKTLQKYIQYGLDTSDELLFWHEHAVIVSNNATKKYHNYGCEDLMLNSFWIYNVQAAEGEGYTMCKKCYEKEQNPSPSALIPFGLAIDKIKYLNTPETSNNNSSTLKVNPKFLKSSEESTMKDPRELANEYNINN